MKERGLRWNRTGGLVVLAMAAWAVPLAGQEPMRPVEPTAEEALADPREAALDARAADIAAQLRCPVCSGQSVLESNSAIAQEMQEVIRERLGAGDSEAEVLEYFRGSYGDWIVLRPRATGLNLVVYILPAVVLLVGLAILWFVARRWVRSRATGQAPAAAGSTNGLSPEDEAWLRRTIGG